MFTGIIQGVGTVATLERRGAGARLTVRGAAAVTRGLGRGASIAVNGCCLTIVSKRGGGFAADLTPETLARTALGGLAAGDRVNLEPPLRAGDALSGHMLQGHVEATARLVELAPAGEQAGWWLRIAAPAAVMPYIVAKGSLAIEGISLTVAGIEGRRLQFAIIPHTYRHTHLAHLRPGAPLNLETDPVARHLERLLEARRPAGTDLSLAALRRQGF